MDVENKTWFAMLADFLQLAELVVMLMSELKLVESFLNES